MAHRILDEIEEMQAQLENQRKTVAGTLTFAAFATATRGIVPAALRGLRANWPGLECHLVEADSHHAMALVEDGSVDIAVVHDWLEMPLVLSARLGAHQLGDDISDALVHESHPLAGCGSVAMADLSDEAWLYEPGSVAHDLLIRSFAGVPNARRFEHVVVEYASQIAMVAEGMGVALVPRMGGERCRTPSGYCPSSRPRPGRSTRSGGPEGSAPGAAGGRAGPQGSPSPTRWPRRRRGLGRPKRY